jgi:hypothetical protein
MLMFNLELCFIVDVLWGMSHNYVLINYFLKINYLVISYLCGFLLGIKLGWGSYIFLV